MAHIVVLATGGTIASTRDSSPGATATEAIDSLLKEVDTGGHTVTTQDVLTTGSYLLTHHHLRIIAEAVRATLQRRDVDGVVLTHGTDTMEETAYLLHLVHDSLKPVVITGAQRTPDSLGADGEFNLRNAIQVAGSRESVGHGVVICFAGEIHPAARTRKLHTVNPSPFGGAGPIGYIAEGDTRIRTMPQRSPALPLPDEKFDDTRIDVVVSHPGADAAQARASVDASADGVIILGTGAGNGNHALTEWVAEASAAGVVVGVSTRAFGGPVLPLYGNGGAADLFDAGAVSLGDLPWSQARILLAYLISAGVDVSPEALADFI